MRHLTPSPTTVHYKDILLYVQIIHETCSRYEAVRDIYGEPPRSNVAT